MNFDGEALLNLGVILAQILVIFLMLQLFYKRFIRGTGAEKLLHGMFMLGGIWLASWLCQEVSLYILGSFLHYIALILSIGLIVVFQPELRKFLALLGSQFRFIQNLVVKQKTEQKKEFSQAVSEIAKAVEYLSQNKIGALLVFQNDTEGILKKGVAINADISTELLLTIFFNKTPLHDGAVVIGKNKILYAGAILPLSENNLKWKYGTRHRAAIGFSEMTESSAMVVSEESGTISVMRRGEVLQIAGADDVEKELKKLLK